MTAGKIRSYDSGELVVEFDTKRCIHAQECVRGLPEAFDPTRRQWENVADREILEVPFAHLCWLSHDHPQAS